MARALILIINVSALNEAQNKDLFSLARAYKVRYYGIRILYNMPADYSNDRKLSSNNFIGYVKCWFLMPIKSSLLSTIKYAFVNFLENYILEKHFL